MIYDQEGNVQNEITIQQEKHVQMNSLLMSKSQDLVDKLGEKCSQLGIPFQYRIDPHQIVAVLGSTLTRIHATPDQIGVTIEHTHFTQ